MLNSKSETLNSKQTQSHKFKTQNTVVLDLEFWVLGLFRI